MKKTSRCLLCALSCLGSISLNSLTSFAIGNIPPFGQLLGVYGDANQASDLYVDRNAPASAYMEYEPASEENESILNVTPDEHGVLVKDYNVEDDLPAAPIDKQSDANKSKSAVEENKKVVKSEKAAVKPVVKQPEDLESAPAPIQTPVQADDMVFEGEKPRKPAEDLNDAPNPVEQKQLEDVAKAMQDVVKNLGNINSKNLNVNSKLAIQVVKSFLKYIPEMVAFAKAKEAYKFVKKARAFDLPHRSYLDLTLLPQFDEIKALTQLLCGVFNIETPSEAAMVENYKNKLPNLIVMNKYLPDILKDVYDTEQAQINGTYELDLTDLNFVNRLVISATSNSRDDSSTLPGSKLRGATPVSTPEERGFAKGLFGKKIGSTITSNSNDDNCAKTVVRKIKNGEIQGKDYF
jgi:hypothetical protein